ncbi:hypothetical protein D8Y24_10905 [Agrococcus lahaulensis]|jgi:hypothetical protein|nr:MULTISPECIES: hypothetical protein [unclassified Agrococcus]MDR7233821.1 hypothetical protein [Agrococcus sp. BE272]RWR19388.1 hypothetical protein D8Y24_10905 [Agrococcus lahaulensis]UOW01690.1 hypothetical protein MU522_04605 [Agrococcus sp. SCSIO52902]
MPAMPPLVVLGLALMAASVVISGIDIVRTMRSGREPERRLRAFLLAAGVLIAGGILVVVGSTLG